MSVCARILWLACLLGSLGIGCSDDHHDEEEEVDASLADVVFEGDTTDEALLRLLAEVPIAEASQAIEFDVPTEGEQLDAAQPVTFVWHTPTAASRSPEPAERPRFLSPSVWQRAVWDLQSLVRPLGVAHAHGAPFNGTAFFLVFSSADEEKLLRVFTDGTSYTPGSDAWNVLSQDGAALELTVTSALFEGNQLTSDGGPFVGGTVAFSVE